MQRPELLQTSAWDIGQLSTTRRAWCAQWNPVLRLNDILGTGDWQEYFFARTAKVYHTIVMLSGFNFNSCCLRALQN